MMKCGESAKPKAALGEARTASSSGFCFSRHRHPLSILFTIRLILKITVQPSLHTTHTITTVISCAAVISSSASSPSSFPRYQVSVPSSIFNARINTLSLGKTRHLQRRLADQPRPVLSRRAARSSARLVHYLAIPRSDIRRGPPARCREWSRDVLLHR